MEAGAAGASGQSALSRVAADSSGEPDCALTQNLHMVANNAQMYRGCLQTDQKLIPRFATPRNVQVNIVSDSVL